MGNRPTNDEFNELVVLLEDVPMMATPAGRQRLLLWALAEFAPDPSLAAELAEQGGPRAAAMAIVHELALLGTLVPFLRYVAEDLAPGRAYAMGKIADRLEAPPTEAGEVPEDGGPRAFRVDVTQASRQTMSRMLSPPFGPMDGPLGDYCWPPLLPIRAGVYPIGARDLSVNERPVHRVRLGAFAIGVFPVTNLEFRAFVAAGGYRDEQWWTRPGGISWLRGERESVAAVRAHLLATWRAIPRDNAGFQAWANAKRLHPVVASDYQLHSRLAPKQFEAIVANWYPTEPPKAPAYMLKPRFLDSMQPVVGVSLHEAEAYVRWLSARSGYAFHLPSEIQWEAAARGEDGRLYPHGYACQRQHANTRVGNVGHPSPVGGFPAGATPEGVHDLAGNVWEWTRSLWGPDLARAEHPYPYAPLEPLREDVLAPPHVARVTKGGSWLDDPYFARSSTRKPQLPARRNSRIGFRVAMHIEHGSSTHYRWAWSNEKAHKSAAIPYPRRRAGDFFPQTFG